MHSSELTLLIMEMDKLLVKIEADKSDPVKHGNEADIDKYVRPPLVQARGQAAHLLVKMIEAIGPIANFGSRHKMSSEARRMVLAVLKEFKER